MIAPKYPNALHGADDNVSLPELTVKAPSGEVAERNRRDFERREGAIEVRLGRHVPGKGWFGGDAVAQGALHVPKFDQADNYLKSGAFARSSWQGSSNSSRTPDGSSSSATAWDRSSPQTSCAGCLRTSRLLAW